MSSRPPATDPPGDEIPIPDNLPDDVAEAYRLGYRRGQSAGHKSGLDAAWKRR